MIAPFDALDAHLAALSIDEPSGQGWTQVAEFGLAFLLSGAIGLEREIRQKAAGLRTYTVVGLGAALFMLISKYGFTDVLHSQTVVLDPSRVAAQIVSGLGFIGAGVIFVQGGSVRGLTTAATIWLTAGVGAACAAGLPLLAALATAAYFVVAYALRPLAHRLPVLNEAYTTFRITYAEGTGLLRQLVKACTQAGFAIAELSTLSRDEIDNDQGRVAHRGETTGEGHARDADRTVQVSITVRGRGDTSALAANLSSTPGVFACTTTDLSDE